MLEGRFWRLHQGDIGVRSVAFSQFVCQDEKRLRQTPHRGGFHPQLGVSAGGFKAPNSSNSQLQECPTKRICIHKNALFRLKGF